VSGPALERFDRTIQDTEASSTRPNARESVDGPALSPRTSSRVPTRLTQRFNSQ
jgi:hypothetical protein